VRTRTFRLCYSKTLWDLGLDGPTNSHIGNVGELTLPADLAHFLLGFPANAIENETVLFAF